MHDDLIDYLTNNTMMGRHSRGEVRLFLERLESDGYEIAKIAIAEPEPPAPELIEQPEPIESSD